jgi:hypothetical protein
LHLPPGKAALFQEPILPRAMRIPPLRCRPKRLRTGAHAPSPSSRLVQALIAEA